MPERILTRPERIAARLCTGALAHLVAGLTDWLLLLSRYAAGRLRGR